MKRIERVTALCLFVALASILILTQGCKKESGPTGTVPADGLQLKGRVVDMATGAGIAGAQVRFGASATYTTDAAGWYQVSCKTAGNGTHDVRVAANGYGYGYAQATVTSNAAQVAVIPLRPLSPAVHIDQNGGVAAVYDFEGLNTGAYATLTVPPGALAASTGVTLTRIYGNEVPGYAPAGSLCLSAVILGPSGASASKEMTLLFPLPFTDATVATLPLLQYDFAAGSWTATGREATIDPSTGTATAKVGAFGTYCLAVPGTFGETNGTGSGAGSTQLDPTKTQTEFAFLGAFDIPGGVSGALSPAWLANLASQNTVLNGARTSLTDSTHVTFCYIGSKPDSIAPSKATSGGYYKWVPKAGYVLQSMPASISVHGASVSGIIRKELFSDACGWEYVHDQGGGGK